MQSYGGSHRERLMMTHIELENFLSFPGVQKIGPFHKKFSIRELNDGGKVNLIDAMLFLFGKRSKQLENNKTAELIHRSSRYPNLEYCRVSAHFQLIIDDESSEEIYEVLTDSAFVITRVAYKDHQAEYMLDNRSSRLTNVALVFMQSGIDLENNRYLFLHGDVTKIANLRPKAVAPHELGLLDYADEIFGPDVVSQQYAVAQGRISTPYNNANIGTPFDQYEPDGFMDPSLSNQQYSQDLLPFGEPQKEGGSGMQRLVDKVVNEFQQNCDTVQVTALDGNGDSFQVYQGLVRNLTAFHFANVLRHPSCFYFFSASAIPNDASPDLEDSVMQRDICWLTDPAPPTVQSRSHNTIAASWPFVSFCGISPPAYIDSVQYILEIAQGVEYKPGYLSRFISDVCAVDYRTVCAGPNIGSTTIQGLLPARWYHLRLSIEYLGQRFVSESQAIHTPTWVPSAPGMPRVNVLPVLSSFDLKSDVPVRLDMAICWNPSSPHGQPITQYQCHIQKFNALGYVVQSCGAAARKEKHNRLRTFYQAPERDPRANQWTQSPGRSAVQIHNSIVLADRSPTRGRTAQARTASRTSSHSNAHSQSPERLLPDVNGHMHDSSFATHSAATTPEERRFKWEIVYDNILTNVKCTSPEADHAEWHIRVRAKNGNGWSDFSPVLKMNGLSHPSLFTLPPPVNAFGTCYYTEHASGQYLDGNAAEQFRHSNDPQQHPHPQGLGPESGMLRSDGINVRNELFLHPRSVAAKSSPKRTAKTPNTLKREDNEARAKQLMDSMGGGTGSGKMGSLGSSGLSGKSGDSIKQAPAKLHVLHFKEGNAWENTHSSSLGSLGSFSAAAVDTPTSTQNEFSSTLPTMSMKKSDSLLPSLGASARMGSSKALFSKG